MKTKLLTFLLSIFIIAYSSAQNPPSWGEVSEYEKIMTVCEYDSTAEAVVLSDYANIEILKYEPLRIKYHKRIKILDEKAKGRADIVIPYFHGNGRR